MKKLLDTKIKKVFFGCFLFIVLFIISPIVIFYISFSARTNIENGELTYTKNCGRIDWGHTDPTSIRKLLKDIMNENGFSDNEKTFSIKYVQNRGVPQFKLGIYKTFDISKGLSKEAKEQVSLFIFMKVSEKFEGIQGKFLVPSSFKDGDLFSNIIGFYHVVLGYTDEEIKKVCEPMSIKESLSIFEKGYWNKNKTRSPYLYDEAVQSKGQSFLTDKFKINYGDVDLKKIVKETDEGIDIIF